MTNKLFGSGLIAVGVLILSGWLYADALYGRNTTGGSINIISKQPRGSSGIKQNFIFGSRNLFRSLTTADFPSWNGVATKLSILKSSIDSHVKNTGSGHGYGGRSQQAAKIQLRWGFSEDILIENFFEEGRLDSTPVYYQVSALNGRILFDGTPYFAKDGLMHKTYRAIDLSLSSATFFGHSLTTSWNPDSNREVKSLTGYRGLHSRAYQDYAEALGFPYSSHNLYKTVQFSEELQPIGSFDTISYVAGLYYFNENGSHVSSSDLSAINLTTKNLMKIDYSSSAAYGQLNWTPRNFFEKIEFIPAIRYTHDRKSKSRWLSNNFTRVVEDNSKNKEKFNRFNPSFTLNYQLVPNVFLYAKVSTGYRAGGSYDGAPRGQFSQTFGPEDLINYELGLKSLWIAHRLRLNASLFDSKLKDTQLVIPADPSDSSVYQAYNADQATIKGGEFELLCIPADDLSIGIDYAYLNANFDRVDVIPGTALDGSINPLSSYRIGDSVKNLFSMPYAPKHSLSLNGEYQLLNFNGGSLTAYMDYRWQSGMFQTPSSGREMPNSDYVALPAHGALNARFTTAFNLLRREHARISFWARNVAHKAYSQRALAVFGGGLVPLYGTDPLSGAINVTAPGYTFAAPSWSEPPSYGLDQAYEYE